MTFGGLLGALRRRWYIVAVGLLATAGLVWGVYNVTPPQYTARGLVLLLPSVPADEEGGNPFLGLGNLDLPARVLVASYSSNAAQEEIAQRAPDAEVVVSIEESTRGPVIAVDVTDSSEAGTLEILSYVADSIPETLASLQSEVGVPLDAVVRSMPLTMDTEPEPEYETLIRLLILAGAGGLALTLLVAYALDGILKRRVRRRSQPGISDVDYSVPIAEEPVPADTDPIRVLRNNVPASPKPASQSRRIGSRAPGQSSAP
jgi:hypothetical protein